MSIYRSDLTKTVDRSYVMSLLVNKEFNENKICHKNKLKAKSKLLLYYQKVILKNMYFQIICEDGNETKQNH